MADIFTKERRSEVMSRIRSKWTKQEKAIHGILKSKKIRHKMHPKIEGSPDLILKDRKVVIFLDSCFFHKCPKCYREPQTNRDYWLPKIQRNVNRDRRNTIILKKGGWKVIRIWEHEITSDPIKCIRRICSGRA
ncbi:MAG: DNA mismatch endonuclease Vsr [Candidatus Aenigmarchaeota archaeon]|nr:DNA mismatch endonuclease Vsr [Candidatus Aenigmarchaeota archaeon]